MFQIALHKKDLALLEAIKAYFGDTGSIFNSHKDDMCSFRVTSPKEISEFVLSHFEKYPLLTQKQGDYLLFRQILLLMLNKDHLKKDGLQGIVNLKASLNLGLSDILKEAFTETNPVVRSVVVNQEISDPEWISGFVTGEGCFFIKVLKGRNTAGAGVQLVFQVAQHIRDAQLLKNLVDFFKCGKYIQAPNREWGYFQTTKFLDNYELIKTFFDKYPVRGIKFKDFEDWSKVGKMIKNKEHLTTDGILKIIDLKSGMNTGRSLEDKDE